MFSSNELADKHQGSIHAWLWKNMSVCVILGIYVGNMTHQKQGQMTYDTGQNDIWQG